MIAARLALARAPVFFAGVWLAACGKSDSGDATGESDSDEPGGTQDTATDPSAGADPTTGATPPQGTGDEGTTLAPETGAGTDTGGAGFVKEPDGGGLAMCDLYAQDCKDGQKCTAYASDGGNAPDATKCVDVAANPGKSGDECTVEVIGQDDCDTRLICYTARNEDKTGWCISFCEGMPAAPTCSDPESVCIVYNNGALPLCIPTCDPLLQDCMGSLACYQSGSEFVCLANNADATEGGYGSPCEYVTRCNPGLQCVAAANVPGCEAVGCCTDFCDTANGNADCTGAADGVVCTAVFTPGAVPGRDNVGLCLQPQ